MNRREAFDRQARAFAGRSPLYERLARELPDEPLVASLLGDDVEWGAPLRLFGGLHYLVLSRRASWDDVRSALHDERSFLEDWLLRRSVHTNEVRRCWALLPCFLQAARRSGLHTLDCIELGCSGGLNLIWDRYGYVYEAGSRAGEPVLAGEEHGRVPGDLLAHDVTVRSRVGVDRDPPDLRTEEGVLLLKAFVWADQVDRLALLDDAVAAWRAEPPPIVRGDLVDELPRLLARRRDDALLLVWETAVFGYLSKERRSEAYRLIADAAGPVAFVRTGRPRNGSEEHYGLFVDADEVAHADFHGASLDWRAA